MKKFIITICFCLLFTSGNIGNQQTIAASSQPTVSKECFTGYIGKAKVHAKLNISGNNVSGLYYYDKYKTNINIKGSINCGENLLKYKTITIDEDTGTKGTIEGIFKTKDYIEGYWSNGKSIYPMYLVREGAKITTPKQPGKETMKFNGHWTGIHSTYFVGCEGDIFVLFDDLIYYDFEGRNGAASGWLGSFGIVNKGTAKTVFADTIYGKKENIVFEFKIKNDLMNIYSNKYDYGCGMGVSFESSFTRGKKNFPMPTALQVGIVNTKQQDDLFKRIVSDKYEDYINYTQAVMYGDVLLDGEKVKAGSSYLRGCSGCCYYIISKKYIYAAIIGDAEIDYYTNNGKYAKVLPKPISDWVDSKSNMKVKFIYVK